MSAETDLLLPGSEPCAAFFGACEGQHAPRLFYLGMAPQLDWGVTSIATRLRFGKHPDGAKKKSGIGFPCVALKLRSPPLLAC